MMTKIRKLLRSKNAGIFGKSVAIQFGGYAISLAMMPLAIAFYTPVHFGMFVVVLFAANLIGTFGGMRLEWAVINEQSDRTADYLMRFASTLLLALGIVMLAVFLTAPDWIFAHFETKRLPMLLSVPVAVAIGYGIFLQAWGIRKKAYQNVYLSRNAVMIARQAIQIGLGLVWPSVYSLILSELGARALGVRIILRGVKRHLSAFFPRRFLRQLRPVLLGRYGHYSRVALPSSVFTFAMTESVPVLFILLHGLEVGGAYWLVQRIFGIPIALIGTVLADIVQGQIARQRDNRMVFRLLMQVTLLLTVFSLIVMPAAAIAFRFLTEHFYNGKWLLSGQISLVMLPAVCIQFIASPISRVLIVREKMHYKLIYDAVLFLALGSWLLATMAGPLDLFDSIAYLAAAQSVAYLVYIAISIRVARLDATDAD